MGMAVCPVYGSVSFRMIMNAVCVGFCHVHLDPEPITMSKELLWNGACLLSAVVFGGTHWRSKQQWGDVGTFPM